MSRPRAVIHNLVDMEPIIAVVRDPDEDVERFYRLARAELDVQGHELAEWDVEPPEWGWFRINPCPPVCSEHGWHIATATGPGPGRWRGSYVKRTPVTAKVEGASHVG